MTVGVVVGVEVGVGVAPGTLLDSSKKFRLTSGDNDEATAKPQRSHSEATTVQLLVPRPPRGGVRGGVKTPINN